MSSQSSDSRVTACDEAYATYKAAVDHVLLTSQKEAAASEAVETATSAFMKAQGVAGALRSTRDIICNQESTKEESGVACLLADEAQETTQGLYRTYVARLNDLAAAQRATQDAYLAATEAWDVYAETCNSRPSVDVVC